MGRVAVPGQRDHGERDGDDQRDALRRHHELARVHAVGDDPCREAEHGERHEPPEDERSYRERGAGELEHEPCERDVLHPRAGK